MKYVPLIVAVLCFSACHNNNNTQAVDDAPSTQTSASVQAASDVQTESTAQTASTTKAYDGPVKSFTAFGNTPASWRAVLVGNAEENGNTLSLEGDLPVGQIEARRLAYARGVEFYGDVQGKEVVLNIRTQKCTEQGKEYPFTATIRYGEKSYKGCALPEAIAHSPT